MKVNSSPVMLVEDEQGRLSERRRPQKETTRETTSKQRKRRKQDHEVIVLSDDYPSEIVPVGIIDLEQGPSNPSARPNAAFLEVPISGNTIDTFGDVEIVRERKRKTRNVQSDRVITLPITESQNSSTRTESLFDPVRTQRSLSGLRINSRSRFNLNPVQLGGSVAQSNTLAYEINRSDEELARRLQQEEYEAQSNIFESGFGNGLLSIPRSIDFLRLRQLYVEGSERSSSYNAPFRGNIRLPREEMEPTYEELLAIGERIGNVKKKGLSTNQLKKLPAAKISKTVPLKSTECVICLEDFNQRVLVTTLACDHSFHKKCISDWLKRNAACPICRREVKE